MTDESNNESNEEPKIIVDEDWKTQVEREKEELKQQENEAPVTDSDLPPLPPANFTVLLSTLATQAMACLGILPDPMTGEQTVNRPLAKHFIDLISMLEEKTKGNLTDDESVQVRDALHQLRMAYVSVKESNTEEEKKSSIELP